jgi:hypothetical protein
VGGRGLEGRTVGAPSEEKGGVCKMKINFRVREEGDFL